MTARAAVIGAGPSGFYAADQLLKAGRRGRPVRRAADAVRARARRRRARPPEDQVGHADVRQDGAASGLPLLRRRRARRRRDAGGAARALPRGRLRGRHADRQPARESPARTARGRSPPPSSSPGTTATPRYADEAFDLSCARAVVIGNGNVAIDVARMLVLDPDELAVTDTADHAIAAFAARLGHRGGRSSAAAVRRRPRSRTPSCASSASWRAPTSSSTRPSSSSIRPAPRGSSPRTPRPPRGGTSPCCASSRPARPAGKSHRDRAALLPLAGRGPRRRATGR